MTKRPDETPRPGRYKLPHDCILAHTTRLTAAQRERRRRRDRGCLRQSADSRRLLSACDAVAALVVSRRAGPMQRMKPANGPGVTSAGQKRAQQRGQRRGPKCWLPLCLLRLFSCGAHRPAAVPTGLRFDRPGPVTRGGAFAARVPHADSALAARGAVLAGPPPIHSSQVGEKTIRVDNACDNPNRLCTGSERLVLTGWRGLRPRTSDSEQSDSDPQRSGSRATRTGVTRSRAIVT